MASTMSNSSASTRKQTLQMAYTVSNSSTSRTHLQILKEQQKLAALKRRQKEFMKKERLIEEVRIREAIWNTVGTERRSRDLVALQWEEISCIMNMDRKACKKMWKHLLDHFRALYHRLTDSKSGDAYIEAISKAKWPLFNHMLFVKEAISKRSNRTASNVASDSPEADDTPTFEPTESSTPTINGEAFSIKQEVYPAIQMADPVPQEDSSMEYNQWGITPYPLTLDRLSDEASTSTSGRRSSAESTSSQVVASASISDKPAESTSSRAPKLIRLTPKRPHPCPNNKRAQVDNSEVVDVISELQRSLRDEHPRARFGEYVADIVAHVPSSLRWKCEMLIVQVACAFATGKDHNLDLKVAEP